MKRRKPDEAGSQIDIFDRFNAVVVGEKAAKAQARYRAVEHERKAGRWKRQKGSRQPWSLNRQRIAKIKAIVLSRHDGPCDTDDAEFYLEIALPYFVKLHPVAEDLRAMVDGWAATLLPTLSRARIFAMIEECKAKEWRLAKADEIGRLLNVTLTERSTLALRTIGAVGSTKAQRLKDRKAKDAAYQALKRAKAGAKPRSEANVAQAKALGISLSTYKRRLKVGDASPTLGTRDPISSAIVRSTYLAATRSVHPMERASEGPARQVSPSPIVGADGHSPRSKLRAVPAGHALALPLPVEGVFEHPDLLDTWVSLGTAIPSYDGGIMPEDLARAVRAAQQARMMTQEAVARQIGVSRPQLTNALQGRFGLSRSAATNLMEWLAA